MSTKPDLRVVGRPSRMVFGLASNIYLERHLSKLANSAPNGTTIVAAADVIVTKPTLEWLLENEGTILTGTDQKPKIGAVCREDAEQLSEAITAGVLPPNFVGLPSGTSDIVVRKLRRREALQALDLRASEPVTVERALFDLVYKGITDVVTRYVWPTPAFHLVRLLARLHVSPNVVTITSILLMLLATWLFAHANWSMALLAAWGMTFLDTVDGKLARVTATSSKLGDVLDHGTDYVHPPAWWLCVAIGIEAQTGAASETIWTSCWVILGTYVAGRASEIAFKHVFGFNQYLWRPFDGWLRMVIARRNVNLVFLTVGALLDQMDTAFVAVALWSIISIAIQIVRFGQAYAGASQGRVKEWLA